MRRHKRVLPTPEDDRLLESIIDCVRHVVDEDQLPAPLHTPQFGATAWEYTRQCLDTAWVSTAGKFVDQFEKMVADFTDARHCIATVNGTAALHICLELCGVHRDDEVIVPSLTFVATANAVSYCGAIPHFVDVDAATLGIDAQRLDDHLTKISDRVGDRLINKKTGRTIAAIVGVHTFGHPFDTDGLINICERFGIPLIEDAAEAIGSWRDGRHCGTIGRLGVLSFNGNKTITTGGGGMILTNDRILADRGKHLTTTGKLAHPWEYRHDVVAYNYRLPNINAAIGCSQMEDLPRFLDAKRRLAEDYVSAFADSSCDIFEEPEGCKSNYWLNALVLEPGRSDLRDALIERLHKHKLLVRPVWTPTHKLPMYSDCPAMNLHQTETIVSRFVNLPSSPSLRLKPVAK